jgi:leucyl-tRNA synthetase
MENYNPKEIEVKWQKKWLEQASEKIDKDDTKKKYYILDMFPYPSGTGLHMGHTESYTASDVFYRFKKMQGFNVLHPQGFDSFGLPAENYAIKTGIPPTETTRENIDNYIRQMKSLGFNYDFSEQAVTSDPEYYKWTQWIFTEFYKNGLVYKKTQKTNWCSSCQTVIANEQVVENKCERCGTEIEQKEVPTWFFKITDFAEELIADLDNVDWPEHTKKNQRNWIGKSEGASVKFQIEVKGSKSPIGLLEPNVVEVFTTRVDTIFGVTYLVVAPEHEIISNLKSKISNFDKVSEYIEKSKNKTELDRMEAKEKTGVELEGIKAVNPFNGEEAPVFVADYVLGNYGTGAVMAVPAHDERDFEFAKKYELPVKQSITPNIKNYQTTIKVLDILKSINEVAQERNVKIWLTGGLSIPFYSSVIYRAHSDLDLIAKDENDFKMAIHIFEDLGFEKVREKKLSESLTNFIYKKDDIEIDIGPNKSEFDLRDDDFEEDLKSYSNFSALTLSKRFIRSVKEVQLKNRNEDKDKMDQEYLDGKILTDDGVLVNSAEFTSLTSEQAREKMTEWLEEKGLGKKVVNYRLRDWSISRQRYWGCPIPIVYSPDGEPHLVSEQHLPWILPTDVDFVPTGVSPLAKSEELKKRTEEIFGKGWTAEYDTMDTFVDSSWYFLRYPDVHNTEEFCCSKRKEWLPVDMYIGGAEHTYMHLLYARFFVKALHKIGHLNFSEPFLKLRHQGMVLDKDGKKMSKSKGNVINPDDMVKRFGADAVRTYMLFVAPLEDAVMWNEENIVGVRRFLDRVWNLYVDFLNNFDSQRNVTHRESDIQLAKTIKIVTDDLDNFKFNTAVASMMKFVNYLYGRKNKDGELGVVNIEIAFAFLKLLHPFAPHMTSELFVKVQERDDSLSGKNNILNEDWPEPKKELLIDEKINLVIQVNGKVRDMLEVDAEITEDDAKKVAMESEKIKNHISGKEIKKIIYVKNKLVSIVT